jgi:hypothetical protein
MIDERAFFLCMDGWMKWEEGRMLSTKTTTKCGREKMWLVGMKDGECQKWSKI